MNLSGGKTRDGGSIVGASVFYRDVSGLEHSSLSPRQARGSQSSLDKLEQELKVEVKTLLVGTVITTFRRRSRFCVIVFCVCVLSGAGERAEAAG